MHDDTHRAAVVLLAEDNEADVELTQLSIKQTGRPIELHTVEDGEQCMAFLRKQGRFIDAPTPQLVLLDLHMPRMNGLEVLKAVREDVLLRHLPVVVLTTSTNDVDVESAYARCCSGYIVKPMGFSDFVRVIDGVLLYWLSLCLLPAERPSRTRVRS